LRSAVKSLNSVGQPADSKDDPLRYALYFTPPKGDPLTDLAARWLGRSAFSTEELAPTLAGEIPPDEHRALTADPRRYGFHATLKAPFELAASVTERDLMAVVEDFAATNAAFTLPELVLGQLGRFFALVPGSLHPPLQDFAAKVVRSFEPFRAPLSEADIARRKPESLDEAHRANLMRWGYPYVMDQFRFHMTLTGQVAEDRQALVRDLLQTTFAAHTGRPIAISGIAVFVEEARGAPFTVHSWLPLAGAQS
jgi:putative phosphonate metabolism protein